MIKRLIWTIWTPMSSVLKKADKLNLSLSPWLLKSPVHQQTWHWLCRTDHIYFHSRDFFKVKFWKSWFSGILGLVDVKWNGSKSVVYRAMWPCSLTIPMTLALNFQGQNWWEGWLTGNEKDINQLFPGHDYHFGRQWGCMRMDLRLF